MLDYIYQGEIQIQQDHLDRFLEVANKFKLEGLMGSIGEETSKTENVNHYQGVEDFIKKQIRRATQNTFPLTDARLLREIEYMLKMR